jgi:hypothetical protein
MNWAAAQIRGASCKELNAAVVLPYFQFLNKSGKRAVLNYLMRQHRKTVQPSSAAASTSQPSFQHPGQASNQYQSKTPMAMSPMFTMSDAPSFDNDALLFSEQVYYYFLKSFFLLSVNI